MEEESFSERMKALEHRIHAARSSGGAPGKGSSAGEKYTQSSLAWRMVTELVAGMLLGLAIGYGLDSLFGTRPAFLVVFALLGFAAGVRTMIRTAEEVREKRAEGARLGGSGKTGPEGRTDETDPAGPGEG
ncbi:MAG: AtpZ/AtpI family protein [Rhodobacteraceae bacterium]|nr:AtpZ/AtpI family protein [Paracoccaceae bacterium]